MEGSGGAGELSTFHTSAEDRRLPFGACAIDGNKKGKSSARKKERKGKEKVLTGGTRGQCEGERGGARGWLTRGPER